MWQLYLSGADYNMRQDSLPGLPSQYSHYSVYCTRTPGKYPGVGPRQIFPQLLSLV